MKTPHRKTSFTRSVPPALTVLLATFVPAFAQTAPQPSNKNASDTVMLSAFKVESTQDKGYMSSAATPFKTNQTLLDIPQGISVVTRDLVDDIGRTSTADALQYAGVAPKFRSAEALSLRGSSTTIGYPLEDGQINRTIFMDNIFVDSYEIIRGPAAVMYPNTALSGVVNKITRKPLSKRQDSVTASITSYGQWRGELDTTGPLTTIGEAKISYRLLVMGQHGSYQGFVNGVDNRFAIHPLLQFDYRNTQLNLAFDYQDVTRPSNPTAVIQPDGSVFTGLGRDMIFLPKGVGENHKHSGFRLMLIQQLSPDWSIKVGGDVNSLNRLGSIVLPIGGVNYATRTVSFFNRRNDIKLDHYSFSIDVNGKYKIAGIENHSTFGLIATDQESINKLWTNSPAYGTTQRIIRPLDNPSIDTVPALPADQWTTPPNPGSRSRSDLGNAYFQQIVDVIPHRLSLVGGGSLYSNETTSNTNISVRPAVATIAKSYKRLFRAGVVFHITKDVVVYALKANTSLPPSTFNTFTGEQIPPAVGHSQEAGIKVDMLDNRLSATVTVYDMKTDGIAVFGGVLPNGQNWLIPLGFVTQKGWEGEIQARLSKNWQLTGNIYSGKVEDQTGQPVDDSFTDMWNFFTRYEFTDGPLKGFAIGGGAARVSGKVVSSAGIVLPAGQTAPHNGRFFDVKPGTHATGFATYTATKNLSFRVSIDNLFDAQYAMGLNAAFLVDPAPRRNATFSARYKF
ncbi:MAG: TonB-dependent receptor [Opitutus sp.]|nr:TonB-dependent receptor [Opitutus sp.]